jgi:hypothetical protein
MKYKLIAQPYRCLEAYESQLTSLLLGWREGESAHALKSRIGPRADISRNGTCER